MHKKIAVILIVVSNLFTSAQTDNIIGIKGGINFASTGELKRAFSNGFNEIETSQGTNLEFGYHFGLFGKLKLSEKFYFRPELVFTKRQNQYNLTGSSDEENLNISTIDAPLLLGTKLIGPISLFVGPSFHYILDKSIDSRGGFEIRDIENDLTFGINAGIAFNFHKFEIDIRYERYFVENLLSFQSNINNSFSGTIDTRAEQVILSLSYGIL